MAAKLFSVRSVCNISAEVFEDVDFAPVLSWKTTLWCHFAISPTNRYYRLDNFQFKKFLAELLNEVLKSNLLEQVFKSFL